MDERRNAIIEKRNATIEWYVNFAQTALDRLGAGDRAKLEVEAREYLFPSIPLPIAGMNVEKKFKTGRTDEKEIDAELQSWIDHAGTRTLQKGLDIEKLPHRNSPQYWSFIVESQKNVLVALKRYSGHFRIDESISHAFYFFLGGEKFEFIIVPLMEKHSDYAVIRLNMALDGLPVTCLQNCQSCGRIFFNPSQRKMKYCSTKCLWRFNTQKRRKAMGIDHRPQPKNVRRSRMSAANKKNSPD